MAHEKEGWPIDREVLMESARHMAMTEAWGHMERYITNRMDVIRRDLLSCDLAEVEAKRAEYRAFKAVLDEVAVIQNPIPE